MRMMKEEKRKKFGEITITKQTIPLNNKQRSIDAHITTYQTEISRREHQQCLISMEIALMTYVLEYYMLVIAIKQLLNIYIRSLKL